MNLHDNNYNALNVDDFLSSDDFDRKGIESCFAGFDKVTCNHCSVFNLIVFDTFFDYFLGNLEARKEAVNPLFNNRFLDLVNAYRHAHNGQMTIHCLHNEGYRTARHADKDKII